MPPELLGQGRTKYSEVAWGPECCCVALGRADGRLEIVWVDPQPTPAPGAEVGLGEEGAVQEDAPEAEGISSPPLALKVVGWAADHTRMVNRVRWHAWAGSTEYGLSEEERAAQWWLATASDDGTARVYDAGGVQGGTLVGALPCLRVLRGHTAHITGLAWSPHDTKLLATASYDKTAQVWDVHTGAAVANMRGHSGRVFAVAWNQLEPGVIFTGSDDHSVRAWDATRQPFRSPPSKAEAEKNKATKKAAPGPRKDGAKPALQPKNVSQPPRQQGALQLEPKPHKEPNRKPRGLIAPSCATPAADTILGDVVSLARQHAACQPGRSPEEAVPLHGGDAPLFGGEEELQVLLNNSAATQASGGGADEALAISHLWRGDVVGAATAAASQVPYARHAPMLPMRPPMLPIRPPMPFRPLPSSQGRLSPMWLGLCAGAGRGVWAALCKKMAAQLEVAMGQGMSACASRA